MKKESESSQYLDKGEQIDRFEFRFYFIWGHGYVKYNELLFHFQIIRGEKKVEFSSLVEAGRVPI